MKPVRRYGNIVYDFTNKMVYEVCQVQREKPRHTQTGNCYECDKVWVRGKYLLGVPNGKLFIEDSYPIPNHIIRIQDDFKIHRKMVQLEYSRMNLIRYQKMFGSTQNELNSMLSEYSKQ